MKMNRKFNVLLLKLLRLLWRCFLSVVERVSLQNLLGLSLVLVLCTLLFVVEFVVENQKPQKTVEHVAKTL